MPNKRPNFQRIIATNDPPKVIDKPKDEEEESQLNIEKPMEPEPYFQTRTVRFNIPTTPRTPEKPHAEEEEKPYYAAHDTFSNPKKSPEEKELLKNDPFYSLRKNYAVFILKAICTSDPELYKHLFQLSVYLYINYVLHNSGPELGT